MRNNDWKHGSDSFYLLLEQMGDIHNRKSHDYASNGNPFANYHFAGQLSKLFNNPDDSGFIGRLAEKIYRIANIENAGKTTLNESIEDTETDICVITALWIASRRERRAQETKQREAAHHREVISYTEIQKRLMQNLSQPIDPRK